MGFTEASPIQKMAIPFILEGRDVIGQAQTGTGKTAAFAIPLLERLDQQSKDIQALILCPTRELAMQVAKEIGRLAAHLPGCLILPIYGGQAIDTQLRGLRKKPQVIVGTPGRVMDHMERGSIGLDNISMVVLDEADEMLNMGFYEDMENILSQTPETSQRLLFSATMPPAILKLAEAFLRNPQMVKTKVKTMTVEAIEQTYYQVETGAKASSLSRLLDSENFAKALIFCATRQGADETANYLQARGFMAEALHGSLDQAQRDRVMGRFRTGEIRMLVATDLAARGLDIDGVEAVINYDMPFDAENYVHRIGRTGRAGHKGRAYTLVSGRDSFKLRQIMRVTKAEIALGELPPLAKIIEIKAARLLQRAQEVASAGGLEDLRKVLAGYGGLDEDYGMELASALLKMMLAPDFAALAEQKKQVKQKKTAQATVGAPTNFVRLRFNLGRKHKVTPGDLVGAIAGESGHPARMIGAIAIYDTESLVDVADSIAPEVMDVMNHCQIRGHKPKVSLDRGPARPGKSSAGAPPKSKNFTAGAFKNKDRRPARDKKARPTGKDLKKDNARPRRAK